MHRALSAATLCLVASTSLAAAQSHHRKYYAPQGDYVVAESHFGKGTVSGPVRPGRHGWEVRLPGGTWIDCGRSCSDALRRATVDFWENNGPQSRESGSPGYFRFRFGY